MQKQTVPTNKSTENNPIKMFAIVSSLSSLSLLFIIVSLITLVHSAITLPTNLFLQTQFLYDCNWTQTHNHLVRKRTLNHLAKLAFF